MNNFDWVLSQILDVEGGYVNDKIDPGGETYMGISHVYHPDWAGWSIIDTAKNGKLPSNIHESELEKEVDEFYYTNYWYPMRLEEVSNISKEVACRMMNIAVHKSRYWAVLWLQEALNLLNINQRLYPDIEEDGLIGNRTIEALQRFFSYDSPVYGG